MRATALRGYAVRPTILFIVSLIVTGLACDKPEDTTSPQAPVESRPSEKPSGTLLRIVGDIPDELGKPERSCRAYIGWSKGNVVRGQNFTLPLAREMVDVPLEHVVPLDEMIQIRFEVDGDPPFKTKFTRGDWGRVLQLRNDASTKVLVVHLSEFKQTHKSVAPT